MHVHLLFKEKLAIEYTKLISQTPIKIQKDFMEKIKLNFTEREIVIIASIAAQVNYWARLIQALGVPPAGIVKGMLQNKNIILQHTL